MAQPAIEPITDSTLPEFGRFLHRHLSASRSPEQWVEALNTDWASERPNFGFLLRAEGEIVGGIGAYYADRQIRGQAERVCNITSWCVLESHRQHSMRLAMAIVKQSGYHYTDFSPTKVVAGVLQFLKFRPLDERQAVAANLPLPARGSVLDRPAEIRDALEESLRKVFDDHSRFPWLRHAVVGREQGWCYVIYKRAMVRGIPCARILFLSDRELFARHFRRFGAYLLARGMPLTQVECRLVDALPWPHVIRTGFNRKLYLSGSLGDSDIDYLYSEQLALDLE